MPLLTTQSAKGYGFSARVSAVAENYELIATTTLTTATSNITFSNLDASSITNNYKHLRVIGGMIEDISNNNSWINVRLNSDTGTNYNYVGVRANGLNITTSAGTASYFSAGASPNRPIGGTTIYPIIFYMDIPMFASTDRKKTINSIAACHQESDSAINNWIGAWNSTNAITSITIKPDSSLNWKTNSSISLYGLKG